MALNLRISSLLCCGRNQEFVLETLVKRVDDFEVDGAGTAAAWNKTDWMPLLPTRGTCTYASCVKVIYSATGIYCLYDCEDQKLTNTNLKDNDDIWNEDVVEVFFWPDESQTLYIEYELSPLGIELPLIVPNHNGRFMGWVPWHYNGNRLIRRATSVRDGAKSAGATVTGWTAEFFIPFALMAGFGNTPPKSGTRWRANFYRIDYDNNEPTLFAWSTGVNNSFHDYKNFGTIVFA